MRFAYLFCCVCAPLLAGDWPHFLGPNHDNKSTERGILLDWPEQGPPLLWSLAVGEGYATPAVVGDRLYFFDRQDDRARLRCLDLKTGKTVWEQTYPTTYKDLYGFSNGPRVTPLVDGTRIYTYGAGGRLCCRALADGKLLWEVDTSAQYGVIQNFFGVGASPVVFGQNLLVPVGGSPEGSPGVKTGKVEANGSALVAFDKLSGQERYRLGDDLAGYATPRVVKRGTRHHGFLFARSGLLAFDPVKGSVDFTFPWRARRLESVNAATPVVIENKVFITESYSVGGALLSFKDGDFDIVRSDPLRGEQSLSSHWATPIYHEGFLYGTHGMGPGSEVRCVAWKTGRVAWKQKGLPHANLLFAEDHLFVLSEAGDLALIKATPEHYDERAKLTRVVPKPAYNGPVLAHGYLLVLGAGRLVCLDLNVDP